jgi:hypothetical protein
MRQTTQAVAAVIAVSRGCRSALPTVAGRPEAIAPAVAGMTQDRSRLAARRPASGIPLPFVLRSDAA